MWGSSFKACFIASRNWSRGMSRCTSILTRTVRFLTRLWSNIIDWIKTLFGKVMGTLSSPIMVVWVKLMSVTTPVYPGISPSWGYDCAMYPYFPLLIVKRSPTLNCLETNKAIPANTLPRTVWAAKPKTMPKKPAPTSAEVTFIPSINAATRARTMAAVIWKRFFKATTWVVSSSDAPYFDITLDVIRMTK